MRYVLPHIRNCAIGRVVKRFAESRPGRRAKVSLRPFSRSELEQERAAVSEVLRAISNSPHELQPIFDTIIQSATGLCRANYGNLRLPETEGFRMVAEVSYPTSVAKRWKQPIFNIPGGPLDHVAVKKSPLPQPGKEALDVNGAIHEVVALVQSEAIKNKVTIRMQCSNNFPTIQADRIQIQQVVLNLIVNAIQAMSSVGEGQRELHITTARGKESQEVSVAVRDTGPGLISADLERVFEPFYTTKPDGMGMGLAICRWIVQEHGGRLWASQADGRGAVFQMTFSNRSRQTTS